MNASPNDNTGGPSAQGTARNAKPETNQTGYLPSTVARSAETDADVRHAAMAACSRGWFVFPCAPDSKRPRFGLKWPEVATSNPARLARAKWRPGENYGIAAKTSGLVIIDLDQPKPGYEFPAGWRDEIGVTWGGDVFVVLAERAGHPLASWPPETFTVYTPSGGCHLYYAALPERPIGNHPLSPLIDVRGGGNSDGGYVLGPGSILNGRAYEVIEGQDPAPLPAWIADLLDPPAAPRSVTRIPAALGSRRGRLVGLTSAVLDAQPGERNNTLHWAACRAAEMVDAGQLTEDQIFDSLGAAAGRIGLDDGEARHTIASALRQTLRSSA